MHHRYFSLAAICLPAFFFAACDQKAPSGPAPAPEARSIVPTVSAGGDVLAVAKPATANDFQRAAKHLDIGGNFLVYWSVDQIFKSAEKAAGEFKSAVEQSVAKKDGDLDSFQKGWAALGKFIENSGVKAVESVSASAFEVQPQLFRARSLVSKRPGARGLLWEVAGRPPHELEFLKMLPKETAFVETLDVDFKGIWASIAGALAEFPETATLLNEFPQEFEKNTGLKWDAFLAELGGEVALAFTLDPAKRLSIPVPKAGNIELSEPGLIIAIRVKGTSIFDRIDTLLASAPHKKVEKDGVKARVITGGQYEGLTFNPTLAQTGEWLILTSREELLTAVIDTTSGKIPGLMQREDFKRLFAAAPAKSNGLIFVGKDASVALQSIQTAAMNSEEVDSEIPESFKKQIIEWMKLPEKLVTVEYTDDGILISEIGDAPMPSVLIAAPVTFAVPVLAAIAVPNFVRARSRSQATVILNEARLLDAATDQWAIEQNISIGAPIQFETIKAYLKPGTRLFQSGGVDPLGNPFIFGKLGDSPQVRVNPATKAKLQDTVPDDSFWGDF